MIDPGHSCPCWVRVTNPEIAVRATQIGGSLFIDAGASGGERTKASAPPVEYGRVFQVDVPAIESIIWRIEIAAP